ncbi:hypothetical protein Bbelb_094420 [Branchiostoma belcheri]|nr:hypothetical protein Bbelb_094420 [Branchiostoma belcheri]
MLGDELLPMISGRVGHQRECSAVTKRDDHCTQNLAYLVLCLNEFGEGGADWCRRFNLISIVMDNARFWIHMNYPELCLIMVLDKARFWILVDYLEPCLSTVLDKERSWIPVPCLSIVQHKARFWKRLAYL